MDDLKTTHWTLTLLLVGIFSVGIAVLLLTAGGCAKQAKRLASTPDWRTLYLGQLKIADDARSERDALEAENLRLYLENAQLKEENAKNMGAADLFRKAQQNYRGMEPWKNGKS